MLILEKHKNTNHDNDERRTRKACLCGNDISFTGTIKFTEKQVACISDSTTVLDRPSHGNAKDGTG